MSVLVSGRKELNFEFITSRKLKKLSVKVQNGELSYECVEGMFKSWIGSFYNLLSKQQRHNLMQLYEELFNKSITVVQKKLIIIDKP